VQETRGETTTDLFYSASWQVLEERQGEQVTAQYVWSPFYVDALVLRDRDTDANGTLDERAYAQQDANYNVTGLLSAGGSVLERYAYDPFGERTVLSSSWATLSSSAYAWTHGHQGGALDTATGNYNFRNRDLRPTIGR